MQLINTIDKHLLKHYRSFLLMNGYKNSFTNAFMYASLCIYTSIWVSKIYYTIIDYINYNIVSIVWLKKYILQHIF